MVPLRNMTITITNDYDRGRPVWYLEHFRPRFCFPVWRREGESIVSSSIHREGLMIQQYKIFKINWEPLCWRLVWRVHLYRGSHCRGRWTSQERGRSSWSQISGRSLSRPWSWLVIDKPCCGWHQRRHWSKCSQPLARSEEPRWSPRSCDCWTPGPESEVDKVLDLSKMSFYSDYTKESSNLEYFLDYESSHFSEMMTIIKLTSELPVSTNCRTPSSTSEPSEKREKDSRWE